MTDSAPRLPDGTVNLTGGARIPLLGFGTWQLKGKNAVRATSAALETGYRHLDTATIYGNEAEVGRALLQTDHVDLWLIHWPAQGSANADMWGAFVEAREASLARDIGVSNFDT